MDWQTVITVGIVAATLAIFVVRLARPGKKAGCGHSCGCGKKRHAATDREGPVL